MSKRTRDDFDDPIHAEADSKKQHIDPVDELISNVCKDIRRMGENANLATQVEDINYISNPIVAEFEKIDKLRTAVLSTIYAVVLEQPQKIPALSQLVLICNAKNFLVAKYVIEFFHTRTQEMLDKMVAPVDFESESDTSEDTGTINKLKTTLRFLACISPIIENNGVVSMFKTLMELAVNLQTSEDTRNGAAEQIYYSVLIALPYLLCNDTSSEMMEQCNGLVEQASLFPIKESDASIDILSPFDPKLSNFKESLPYVPKKITNLILPALLDLQGEDKKWSKLIGHLFLSFNPLVDPILKDALSANTISNDLVKHNLPQFSIPSVDALHDHKPTGLIDELWYHHPRLLFQVYNNTLGLETVPPIESFFGLFFKDLAFDILTNLSFNKDEASIQLSILDLYFSKDLFAPPGSSIDQLKLIQKDNEEGVNNPPLSTWKIEDIAVESILTMIFQLPRSLHHEIYYYTVLIACCRESPESIAPVFGRAIRYFYNHLETLDYELKIRFLDWMTIQISNFDYSWKWDEWVDDSVRLRNLKHHPKRNFIKNLIAKEIRLSNKNRIKESFVAVNPDPDATDRFVLLEEFYKYLNLSLVDNPNEYIASYDSKLYGNDEEISGILKELQVEALDKISQKSLVSAQDEVQFYFGNNRLPLHEISNKVYEFLVAQWKPNEDLLDIYQELQDNLSSHPAIDAETFTVNVFLQTYAYLGSRSIYSVVSLISRDKLKLKYLLGAPIDDKDYVPGSTFRFEERNLTQEQIDKRQNLAIDSIFRLWVNQSQMAFLLLEYLIEYKILQPIYLVGKCLSLETNLVIDNVACMESINRILESSYTTDRDEFNVLYQYLLERIIQNLSLLAEGNNDEIKITTEFSDEEADDLEKMNVIDKQWLFYEYTGLLKSYLRKYYEESTVTQQIQDLTNEPAKQQIMTWIEELSRK